jgi:hypothetical protein
MYVKMEWEGLDWIYLALDGDQWWAVVNVVINLHINRI